MFTFRPIYPVPAPITNDPSRIYSGFNENPNARSARFIADSLAAALDEPTFTTAYR